MPDNGTIFEILSVELNTEKLKTDLKKLDQSYKAFVEKLPPITPKVQTGQLGQDLSRIGAFFNDLKAILIQAGTLFVATVAPIAATVPLCHFEVWLRVPK